MHTATQSPEDGMEGNYISSSPLITAFIYRNSARDLGKEEGRYWGLIAPDDGA